MRFAPSKAALAVAAVIVLAVGAGAFGISRLLNVTTVHYHAANTAADLKFDLSVLGSFNDQYASATPSQQQQLVVDIPRTERRIGAELTSLKGTGFEPSDTAAIDGHV